LAYRLIDCYECQESEDEEENKLGSGESVKTSHDRAKPVTNVILTTAEEQQADECL
jgi:hypothetical protein